MTNITNMTVITNKIVMINGMHVFVGASTARPPIWRCSAFTKKLIVNQTARGEHCSPLQALQLTTSDDTYEYYDNYEVYDLYDIYNYYSNCKRLPFEGSSRAAGEGWVL